MSTENKALDLLLIDLLEQQAALLKAQIIQLKVNAGVKVDAPSDDSDRKKRTKQIVDPNKPKRSPSGYHLFMSDHTGNFKLSNPGMSQTEIMTIIAKRWTDLDQASRKVYLDKADKLKAQYIKELHEYELKSGFAPKKSPPSETPSVVTSVPSPNPPAKKVDTPVVKKRKADEITIPIASIPAAKKSIIKTK